MRLGIFYQPFHSANDISLGRKSSRILGIICQDQNVLCFKIPVLYRVHHVNETVIYAERTEPTREEFADVLGVVHTTLQFPGRSCVVDSDLNRCRVSCVEFDSRIEASFLKTRTHTAFFFPVHLE